jgi:hypothetical protein
MLITSVTTTHLHSFCQEEFPDRIIYVKVIWFFTRAVGLRSSKKPDNPPGFFGYQYVIVVRLQSRLWSGSVHQIPVQQYT